MYKKESASVARLFPLGEPRACAAGAAQTHPSRVESQCGGSTPSASAVQVLPPPHGALLQIPCLPQAVPCAPRQLSRGARRVPHGCPAGALRRAHMPPSRMKSST